jgi:hypothetical protein
MTVKLPSGHTTDNLVLRLTDEPGSQEPVAFWLALEGAKGGEQGHRVDAATANTILAMAQLEQMGPLLKNK